MKGFVTLPSLFCTRVLSTGPHFGAFPKVTCARLSTATRSQGQANNTFKYVTKKAMNVESGTPLSFPREITWLAGAPGAGKGTNSSVVAVSRGYKAPTIVMSSLLENAECKRIKDAGGMVDDATVQRALLSELTKPEYKDGVVVDGFPRTEKQAAWLNSLHDTYSAASSSPSSSLKFNFVMLYVDEAISVARQLSRGDAIRKLNVVRSANGLPPLEERATDVCDVAARLRYKNFLQQYEAINKLSARFPLTVVDASAPLSAVRQRLFASLHSIPATKTTKTPSSSRQFVSTMNTHTTESSLAYT